VPSVGNPWNAASAVHLYRRTTIGASLAVIQTAINRNPLDVVNDIIDEALNMALTEEPEFAFKPRSEYGIFSLLESVLEKDGYARDWIKDLQTFGLRGVLELFWHNHFVTRFDVYESASYMYQYHKLLQTHALGNFKEIVREMGLTPAKMVFLNGSQSTKDDPNENYARELYELFTLGVDNGYTQADIEETARALTGYTNIVEEWGPIEFKPEDHDDGVKSIFGQEGNWGYDDVIDILFDQRAEEISLFITGKLYEYFVNPDRDEMLIAELAVLFRESNWDIALVLRTFFKSEHFFDSHNHSTIIPGHVQHIITFFNEIDIEISELTTFGLYAETTEQGQALFNPVDVAGWPGNRSWIDTTSIAFRWSYLEAQVGIISLFAFGQMQEFVRNVTTETLDVEVVCRDILHYFLPKGLQFESDYEDALINFKGQIPQNYFEDGTWTTDYFATPFQLADLIRFIIRIPEYQLK